MHPSAWKGNSRKFEVAISVLWHRETATRYKVSGSIGLAPSEVATNGARNRSKQLRLDTVQLPENFGDYELRV